MNIAVWADQGVAEHGDYDALVAEDRSLTSRELQDESSALAGALAAAGLEPGDRVVVLLPNCAQVVVSQLAGLRAGGTAVLLHPSMKSSEVEQVILHCRAKVVVTTRHLAAEMTKAMSSVPIRIAVAAGDSPPAGWTRFEDCARHAPLPEADIQLVEQWITAGAPE